MLHGRACPVAEVDGGRRLSCAGEGSLQRCIGSYRLTLDRRSGRAARRCSEGQAHPPSRSTDSLPGVPITGRETSPVTRRAAAGLQHMPTTSGPSMNSTITPVPQVASATPNERRSSHAF